MVLLLTDVFLLLTQVLLWIVVGLITWFVLFKTLPRAFLSLLVLVLILVVLALSFFRGPPVDGGVIEILWRIISFPFTPLGLAIVFLALLLSGRKLSKLVRNLLLGFLILLALGTLPVVAYFLAQELEFEAIELIRAQPALTVPGSRRVIVLLGQETTRPQLRPQQDAPPANPPVNLDKPVSLDAYRILTQLPVQLTERGDNIIYAAQLYRNEVQAGTSPLIIVSAGQYPNRRRKDNERTEDISEARSIQRFLTDTLGVPAESIVLDNEGTSIRRSAERVRQILTEQNINPGNQITLVGTALNMNRAVLTFEDAFDDPVAIYARPTDFYTLPPARSLARVAQGRDVVERSIEVTDLLPSVDAFYISSEAIEEYLNAIYYFLRGWIRPLR